MVLSQRYGSSWKLGCVNTIRFYSDARKNRKIQFVKSVIMDRLLFAGFFKDEASIQNWIRDSKVNMHRYNRVSPDVATMIYWPLINRYRTKEFMEMLDIFLRLKMRFSMFKTNLRFINRFFKGDIVNSGSEKAFLTISDFGKRIITSMAVFNKLPKQLSFGQQHYLDALLDRPKTAGLWTTHLIRNILDQSVNLVTSWQKDIPLLTYDSYIEFNPNLALERTKSMPFVDTIVLGQRKLGEKQIARLRNNREKMKLKIVSMFAVIGVKALTLNFRLSSNIHLHLTLFNNRLCLWMSVWKGTWVHIGRPDNHVHADFGTVDLGSEFMQDVTHALEKDLVKFDLFRHDPSSRPLKAHKWEPVEWTKEIASVNFIDRLLLQDPRVTARKLGQFVPNLSKDKDGNLTSGIKP